MYPFRWTIFMLLVSEDFNGHIATGYTRHKHNLHWNEVLSVQGAKDQAANSFWFHSALLSRSGGPEISSPGLRRKKRVFLPLAPANQAPVCPNKNLFFVGMNRCVERREARTYGLKDL